MNVCNLTCKGTVARVSFNTVDRCPKAILCAILTTRQGVSLSYWKTDLEASAHMQPAYSLSCRQSVKVLCIWYQGPVTQKCMCRRSTTYRWPISGCRYAISNWRKMLTRTRTSTYELSQLREPDNIQCFPRWLVNTGNSISLPQLTS